MKINERQNITYEVDKLIADAELEYENLEKELERVQDELDEIEAIRRAEARERQHQ